ncbi:hypothetical protein Tco_0250457 [Tanacetum coccineum]
MGDKNLLHTLGDYSRPSNEGYRNTIEVPNENDLVPLRSDTIRLVQNGCSFHELQSEDPNQHLKDFLKIVDSIDLNVETRERTRLQVAFYNLLEKSDILMFQQHQGIVRNVEVLVGKLKLFEDFHALDIEREPTCPLLVRRGFLATANAVINCKKTKISVGEGLTRSIFRVKDLDFGDDNEPYWTTIGKHESYKPRTSKDSIGAQPSYYVKRDFWNNHSPREWEIASDVKVNPFKDVLVFRKMVEFLGAIPINLKGNMWESKDLIENPIDWNRPPKEGDGLGSLKPIKMTVEMADRSMQSPKGIKENVLVKISRPMLAIAHAKIDVYGKKISLGVGNDQGLKSLREDEDNLIDFRLTSNLKAMLREFLFSSEMQENDKKQGTITLNRGLIQAIPTSIPPQPIGEATKASNLQRIPPGVQGRSHFTYFLYLIVQIMNPFLQNILDLYFKHFKLSEDVVNRILQVVLDLQHFKSSHNIFAATILQSSSAIHHISNIDNMYIKSYSFSLFSSLPGVLTPVRGESLKILNGFDVSLPVSHSLWSSLVNWPPERAKSIPLAPRKGKFHGGLITIQLFVQKPCLYTEPQTCGLAQATSLKQIW